MGQVGERLELQGWERDRAFRGELASLIRFWPDVCSSESERRVAYVLGRYPYLYDSKRDGVSSLVGSPRSTSSGLGLPGRVGTDQSTQTRAQSGTDRARCCTRTRTRPPDRQGRRKAKRERWDRQGVTSGWPLMGSEGGEGERPGTPLPLDVGPRLGLERGVWGEGCNRDE